MARLPTLRRNDCDDGIVAGGAVHDECEEFNPSGRFGNIRCGLVEEGG